MRGRTLNDAFIILDEAQNTTPEQMKMFLTRLGFGSKIVVTGDITQVDLPGGQRSGLRVVQEILDGVDDVHFSMLTSHDVVRHKLVGRHRGRLRPLARHPGRGNGTRTTLRTASGERCPARGSRGGSVGREMTGLRTMAREHRDRQRVGRCGRRGLASRRRPVRARPDGGQPAGRAVRAARRVWT